MSFKSKLLSTTIVSFLASAGVAVSAQAAPGDIELADAVSATLVLADTWADGGGSCNPCAAKACNPCNPCAAKACNPCNPCAAKACNPCNPCAAKAKNPCGGGSCNPDARTQNGKDRSLEMAVPHRFTL